MKQLFSNIFQRIFNHSPSHLLLFELITLFSRFKKMEKELEKLQSEIFIINQQHNSSHLKKVESRLYKLLYTLDKERVFSNTNNITSVQNDSSHRIVDGLIEPLCNLLTENGFFTFASCSGHVSVQRITPNHYWKKENWYVLFTTQNDLSIINHIIDELKDENITLSLSTFERPEEEFPFPVFKLSASLKQNLGNFNDHSLYQFNKKLYLYFHKTLNENITMNNNIS